MIRSKKLEDLSITIGGDRYRDDRDGDMVGIVGHTLAEDETV